MKIKKTTASYTPSPAVNIGGAPDKITLEAASAAILAILSAPCGDTSKTEAMVTLREIARSREVSNVSLSNFSIVSK